MRLRSVVIEDGRFRCAEGLFDPNKWGKDHEGIHKLVERAIKQTGIDHRKEMCRLDNISEILFHGLYCCVCMGFLLIELFDFHFAILLLYTKGRGSGAFEKRGKLLPFNSRIPL